MLPNVTLDGHLNIDLHRQPTASHLSDPGLARLNHNAGIIVVVAVDKAIGTADTFDG